MSVDLVRGPEYGQEEGVLNSSSDKEPVWMDDTRLEKTMIMFPQERKWVSLVNALYSSTYQYS